MRRREAFSMFGLIALSGCLAPSGGGANSPDRTTETLTDEQTDESGDETTTDTVTTTTEPPDWTAELTPVDIHCASSDATAASVSFGTDAMEVTGTIVGADMCYVPELDRVEYVTGADRLIVVVTSVRKADEDTACAQCIAGIEYLVDLKIDGSMPSEVEVRHLRDGKENTVTTATR